MGNSASFAAIEKKHGREGINYVVSKYHQRKIYATLDDEIQRLNDHVNIQEKQDLNFIDHLKKNLDQTLKDARTQAETKKKGSVAQAEAKSKQNVEAFSGFNEEKVKLEKLQKDVKTKYDTERKKMEEHVREQVQKHQQNGGSRLTRIPEYDNHPDNYRKNIEDQCIKKYPAMATAVDATALQKKITWNNYQQNFVNILDKKQTQHNAEDGCKHVRNNVVPGGAPVCC